jgi:hypothetical protein
MFKLPDSRKNWQPRPFTRPQRDIRINLIPEASQPSQRSFLLDKERGNLDMKMVLMTVGPISLNGLVSFVCNGHLRFPVWQFRRHSVLPGIRKLVSILCSDDKMRVIKYFLTIQSELGNRRPLDLLRTRRVAEVITHAEKHFVDDSW